MDDDGYGLLQAAVANNPGLGDVIPGAGGFRKLRWSDPRRGEGKRGGLRVIYYHFPAQSQIWFLALYGKDEAKDLTARERAALREAIQREKEARRRSTGSRKR